MAATTTVTIRVSPEVKEKLGRLARDTRRSRAFLAAEAVADYVDRELEIIEGIERGRADVRAGRVVPHEQAVAEVEAVLKAARDRRR
ncbi:MAG TPA: CopG family transcriptional regulator [Hyphomicrobiales bacterium]|nr:CopG family transcriptional regulator [Hyphomicrobiales bacterium]